jgi:hypothetical protein
MLERQFQALYKLHQLYIKRTRVERPEFPSPSRFNMKFDSRTFYN